MLGLGWVLPPLSNSWIITMIWLYIALNRMPNKLLRVGGGSTQGLGYRVLSSGLRFWGLGFRGLGV